MLNSGMTEVSLYIPGCPTEDSAYSGCSIYAYLEEK